MAKRLRGKAIVIFVAEIICLILLGVFLMTMQTNLAISDQKTNTEEKLVQVKQLIAEMDAQSAETTRNFDETYQAYAETIAYMYQKGVTDERTTAKMQEFSRLYNIKDIFLADSEGNVIAQSGTTPANFTYERFNQLRQVFNSSKTDGAVSVEYEEGKYRYYAARVDDNTAVVLETDGTLLENLLQETDTWESKLDDATVGLNGFTFAVSQKDHTFLYYPNEEIIGRDAVNTGIPREDLREGFFGWITVDGERLYVGVTEADDAYVICAVTDEEIASFRRIVVGVILFVFFAIMTLLGTYGLLLLNQEHEEKENETSTTGIETQAKQGWHFHKGIARKVAALSVIGLILILVISFYMQTLFSLSRQSLSNEQKVADVEQTITDDHEAVDNATEEYNEEYLTKARIAAYILDAKPELQTRNDLAELSMLLNIETINVFNQEGTITATNGPVTNFTLSTDPESQSYAFRSLLQGVEYLVQDAQENDASGELMQYIGYTLRDANGNANGFVQIAILPERLEHALASLQIDSILSNVTVGKGGFAFAVNIEDQTFASFPDEKLIGRKVTEYGMEESQLRDQYSNYITINNIRYFAASVETTHYYVYIATPASEMSVARVPLTIATGVFALICFFIFFLLLTISRKEVPKEEDTEVGEEDRVIDVVMPDGTVKTSETAVSRWENITMAWGEKSPEQQFGTILKGLVAVFAMIICFAVVFKDTVFDSSSIFLYIMNGHWERGINIFAITASMLIICVVMVASMAIRAILNACAKAFGARGETICRLLRSFIKYVAVVGAMYYCLALFGVDTQTLLASAGILSLVIGLGAKTLVADILAGLFIIFEGEFRVGDIVTVAGYRGTVVEIGVRTTKIQDGSQNIKIISNSEVTNVINMTKKYSYCWCDVGIEYGESLERVENILEKEFPNIRKRLPNIKDGPFYKGVVALGDSSVNLRVMVLCSESERVQMERDLNREMKLIFDKYNINIPFPQVVVNEPVEYEKATAWEKYKADKFNEDQKEKSRDIIVEQKED